MLIKNPISVTHCNTAEAEACLPTVASLKKPVFQALEVKHPIQEIQSGVCQTTETLSWLFCIIITKCMVSFFPIILFQPTFEHMNENFFKIMISESDFELMQ